MVAGFTSADEKLSLIKAKNIEIKRKNEHLNKIINNLNSYRHHYILYMMKETLNKIENDMKAAPTTLQKHRQPGRTHTLHHKN